MSDIFTSNMLFGENKEETPEQEFSLPIENGSSENQLINIEIDRLVDFRNKQPFSYSDEDYEELKESINKYGIFESILVRPIEDNKYEIINGHHRVKCARELGIPSVSATVNYSLDDIKANYMVLELTLKQRKNIPPCEKGRAYKLQLELLKKMKVENRDNISNDNDLEDTVHSEQLDSIDELSNNSPDGRTTIQRLIRLAELIPELQLKVDNKFIPILAGVELSYINAEEQILINNFIDNNNYKLKVPQAEKLRAKKGELTEDEIINIINGKAKKKKEVKFTGKLKKNTYSKYKDKFADDDEFDSLIDQLLEDYFNNF